MEQRPEKWSLRNRSFSGTEREWEWDDSSRKSRPTLTGVRSGDRAPDQQALLDHADKRVDQDHETGEHEHAGKHAGDVKHAFGLLDEVAKPGGRAEILAHHRAHHREAH